jgi:1-acyl-sn-glycerol-3-phosphate acyltransferase
MSKQILGDNPFDDSESQDDDERTDRDTEASSETEPAAGARTEARTPADRPPASRADRSPQNRTDAGDEASPVPDAAVPGTMPADGGAFDLRDDDLILGGEAAIPPGEYGPPIPSVLPDESSITSEIRELERRVRARLTPAFPIEHRRRLPLEFVWKRYRRLAMRGRAEVIDDFGRDPVYTTKVEPWLDFLYRRYFRVEATGIDNVPASGRAILVANHSGTLPFDGAILMHAIRKEHPSRRDLRPLVEDFVFHFPYLGVFINRIGGVRACPENAERLLEEDELIAVFPEGIQGIGKLYKDRYRLQRFGRGGFIKLALRSRAPVIPVSIVGAEETQPMVSKVTWFTRTFGLPYLPITPTFPLLGPLGLVPLPAKWRIHFGEPLDLAAEHDADAADDRILVSHLAETVRSRIQGMLDDTLASRRSVVFG